MNESQFYETIGRKQVALDNTLEVYGKLLSVIQMIHDGKIEMRQLKITGPLSWEVANVPPPSDASDQTSSVRN